MKSFKLVLVILMLLAFTYIVFTTYAERIEKIENGELIQVSESYRDR